MITLSNKADCCGCSACVSACPHKAVSFVQDSEGFMYPQVDTEKCINCGLCEKVCPIIKYKELPKDASPKVYAAINKDTAEYFQSSSGGIFILLCKYIISLGGVVCGVRYDDNFQVKHTFAHTLEECIPFMESKYVQSDIQGIFPEIRQLIKKSVPVLFSGTPCQVAGLKTYLQKDYQNLFTTDIICHGVPSPLVFKDYLTFVKGKREISHINMKSKSAEKGTAIRIDFADGKSIRRTLKTDLWNKLYFSHYIVRPSCHDCQFTHYNRAGDITIGDYWGISKYYPKFYSEKMVSLVMVNNDKGNLLFNEIFQSIDAIQINKYEASQNSLKAPCKPNSNRCQFWIDYSEHNFKFIANKYLDYNFYNRLKEHIRMILLRR